MRYFIMLCVLFLVITSASAGNDAYLISQNRFAKIMPIYQHFTISDDSTISEVSVPVFIYFPMGRTMSLSVQGNQANVGGNVTTLRGFSDTQMSFNYHLESAHLVFNLGINLPSGKKELTMEEFQTSAWLSLNYFNFQVPNLGQGFNISPGLTWAMSLSDRFVLGLGASYQYKGKFKPVKSMAEDYDPGDEILVTGGFDFRLSSKTTLATDVFMTSYGPDKIKDTRVFVSGKKMVVTTQLRHRYNFNELLVIGRYRSKGKNSYDIGGILQEEMEKTMPDQFDALCSYRLRMGDKIYFTLLFEGRTFFATPYADQEQIFGAGCAPEIIFSRHATLTSKLKYFVGTFGKEVDVSGFEIGLGFSTNF